MSVIGMDKIEACYMQAKSVFDGRLTKKTAVGNLTDKTKIGMKKSSAIYYLNAYLSMRTGKTYKKTINEDATRYYLENILKDDGKVALKLALQSLEQHIQYYSIQGKGELQSLKTMHDEFVRFL